VIKHTTLAFVLFSVALLTALPLTAQEHETFADGRVVPEVRATRVNPRAPVVDGDLNDVVWNNPTLELARSFTQRDPNEGEPATESTLVAVVYDDEAIYFAFWNYDSEPDAIARQLVRRDRYAESDKVMIRLDPYHDHQTGFEFRLSAAGVQEDSRIYNDDNLDFSWDGVWESAVKMQPWGWSAEIRIPYHCLRFAEKEEHVWGVNFARVINRKNENARWSFSPSSEGGFASKFGHLTGLSGIEPSRHLEILPYVVSSLETEPGWAGNPDGRDYFGNVGLDVKYGVSSNLTLDATVNPDFGQVELDQPVLNLSTFETYFSERRPFFVEGSDLFRSEFTMFYSRRIGRSPRYGIDDDDLDYVTKRPKASTILGAAKLTGKIGSGTNIAFLNALTEEEKAEYKTVSDETREAVVEPQANYSVFRIKQDVLSRSSVGGILTVASQDTEHPAVTGGGDWRLYTSDGMWRTVGQVVFSRNDAENTGFGVDAKVEKAAGNHLRGAVGVEIKDPHLNLNRLGYLGRNNVRHGWAWMQYRTQDDWWIVRNSWSNLNTYHSWNYNGDNVERGWNFNSYVEFTNDWSFNFMFAQDLDEYDDRETRGNGLWKRPKGWRVNFGFDTDNRKKLSFGFYPNMGHYRNDNWWALAYAIDYRPLSNLEFSTYARYSRDYGMTWWLENYDDTTSIFTDMNQDWLFMEFSASVMLHRNLSCQLSAQGLITSLDYYNHRVYLGEEEYGATPVPYDESYGDYNYSALNSTLLVRWEYRPGSTLYLVWTRSRSEVDDTVNNTRLGRDFDRFFSTGSNNVFLAKISYWFNS